MIYTKKDLRLKLKAKNKLLASYQEQLDDLKRENQRLKNKIHVLGSNYTVLRKQAFAMQTKIAIYEKPEAAKELADCIKGILSVGR